jgi:O-antigen/teichoic acid export membrane protein
MSLVQRIKHFLNKNPILQKIARNFGYLFSSSIIASALSMVQGIFSVRLLGVAGFGQLGTITVFATTVNKITSFRMGELVIKYVGLYHETGKQEKAAATFKAAALIEFMASLLAFGLIWLLAPLGAEYFTKDASLANWFVIYGLVILANMFSEASTGLLQLFDRFRSMAWLNIVQSVVTLGLIILAWWQDDGLLGILVAYLVGKAIHAIGLSIAAITVAKNEWGNNWWKTPLKILKPESRELGQFAVSTNINNTLTLITRDSSVLWVSYFSNPEQVGYFKLALALANYIQIPMAPMPQATYPELARAVARKKWDEFRYILKQGSRIAGGYSILVALGLVVFGKPLISLLYGPEFLPSYVSLLLMLIGIVFANTVYWARSALLSFGLAEYATKVNLLVTVVSVIGYILLLPSMGHLGAALIMTIGNVLGNSLVVYRACGRLRHEEKLEDLNEGAQA